MDMKLNVMGSPHVRDSVSTRKIMLDVIIALLPASIWGVMCFGMHSLFVILITIACSIFAETIFNIIAKKPNTVGDLSCVVTGLILALNMPPEIPLFIPVIGAFFSIIVVKMLFGGLGQNFMNPALAGRCFLLTSFAGPMSDFTFHSNMIPDTYSSATPLKLIDGGMDIDNMEMFLGYTSGAIGEISVACLLLGAIYLLAKKVIDIKIPFAFIGTLLVCLLIAAIVNPSIINSRGLANFLLDNLCTGGLIFGAFYMATDYVTSPVTPCGQIVLGIFLGLMTAIFRLFGKSTEAISFVILLGNILTPLIESMTIPKAFGKEGK